MKQQNPVPFSTKLLVSYLYFIQGIFLALPATIVLTYATMPSYDILTYFSIAPLPWSFKFITAPLIEKYTSLAYGKRKTWIVITLLISSALMFVMKFVTSYEDMQLQTAFLLTFTIFFVSLQDISTDALANKELKDARLISFLQSIMQKSGVVVGSLLFLKFINPQFGMSFGLKGAIFTVPSFFMFISLFSLLPAIFIHFFFEESITVKEQNAEEDSLTEILIHYRHFINPKYTVARQCILFLTFYHGINYFLAGYSVQLIKSGYNKELMSEIQNASSIPSILLSFVISRFINTKQVHQMFRLFLLIMFISYLIFFKLRPTDAWGGGFIIVVISILSQIKFFLSSIVINLYADSKYSALCITILASFTNLGNSSTMQLKIISLVGYQNACYFGFLYTAFILFFSDKIVKWSTSGDQEQEKLE